MRELLRVTFRCNSACKEQDDARYPNLGALLAQRDRCGHKEAKMTTYVRYGVPQRPRVAGIW